MYTVDHPSESADSHVTPCIKEFPLLQQKISIRLNEVELIAALIARAERNTGGMNTDSGTRSQVHEQLLIRLSLPFVYSLIDSHHDSSYVDADDILITSSVHSQIR